MAGKIPLFSPFYTRFFTLFLQVFNTSSATLSSTVSGLNFVPLCADDHRTGNIDLGRQSCLAG